MLVLFTCLFFLSFRFFYFVFFSCYYNRHLSRLHSVCLLFCLLVTTSIETLACNSGTFPFRWARHIVCLFASNWLRQGSQGTLFTGVTQTVFHRQISQVTRLSQCQSDEGRGVNRDSSFQTQAKYSGRQIYSKLRHLQFYQICWKQHKNLSLSFVNYLETERTNKHVVTIIVSKVQLNVWYG